MKVSVVVCVYNEILYVEKCLRSLANQFVWFDYEVLIVDDASVDGLKPGLNLHSFLIILNDLSFLYTCLIYYVGLYKLT